MHYFGWRNKVLISLYVQIQKDRKMNRIKEVLEEKGVKQTWLAEKLGKSFAVVNGYAQNRKQPRLEILFEIASLLNVDPKDLLVTPKKKKSI